MEDELIIQADLSQAMLANMKELFEIEILQGDQRELPNGLTRVNFKLSGANKAIFEDLMRMLVQVPSVKWKCMGLPVNKN